MCHRTTRRASLEPLLVASQFEIYRPRPVWRHPEVPRFHQRDEGSPVRTQLPGDETARTPQFQQLESAYAAAPNHCLDPLRHLLNDPGLLAPDSSARRVLALTANVAVQNSPAHLDRNVGTHGHGDSPVARRPAL